MKKVAVTGGIASGKTTVCRIFEKLGAYVISADAIVHELLVPTTQLGKDLIILLGDSIVEDQTLSRKRIAQKVFDSPQLLRELEKHLHPEVQKVIESHTHCAAKKHAPLFVVEVPLLYEAKQETNYDAVIVVVCDEEIGKKRFSHGEEEFLLRNRRLLPLSWKISKADYVIYNNGKIENLNQTIQYIYKDLKE